MPEILPTPEDLPVTIQEARKHPRSQKAIGESEEWLFTALQSIGDAVIATDADGLIVFMNLVAVKLTGWTEDEAQGVECRKVFHIVNETTRQETESPVAKVLRDGVIAGLANHTILIARDGVEYNIDDSGSPIRDKEGSLIGVVLIFRDITEKRKGEQTRQEQLEILQTLFDHIPIIVTILDDKQNFKWVNREWTHTMLWSLEELQSPERLAEFAPLFAPVLGWSDLTLTVKDGRSVDLAWATVRLSDGSCIGIGHDITQIAQRTVNAETQNRSLERSMRETDHRVKNNLQLIISLLDMQATTGETMVPVERLVQVRTDINMVAAIHNLLVPASGESSVKDTVSAKAALASLLPMLAKIVGEQRLRWSVEDVDLPIRQSLSLAVLINELVSNAVKHGGEKVDVNLALAGGNVTLEVRDDGPGFPQAFQPVTGANFGLEMVESVVRHDLGGVTAYENRPEGGASVRLVFPLMAASLSHESAAPAF